MKVAITIVCAALAVPFPAVASVIFAFSPSGTQTLTVNTSSGSFALQAFETGWYTPATNSVANSTNNYVMCDSGCGSPGEHRDFFGFRLGTITGTFQSASLSVGNPSGGLVGSMFNIMFWDVTSDATALGNGTGGSTAFNDLGSGTAFGGRSVSSADNNIQVVTTLNAAALAAISAALSSNGGSGVFILGGAVDPVPEPATFVLLGLAFAGLTAARKFTRRSF